MDEYYLPPEIWSALVFMFLDHRNLCAVCVVSKSWLPNGSWACNRVPLRVGTHADIKDLTTAVAYASLQAQHRVRLIIVGPGVYTLPMKPSSRPPCQPPPQSHSIEFNQCANLTISGTLGGVGGCGQEDGGNEVSSCPAEELASRKKTRGNEVSSCPAEALACRKKTRGAPGILCSGCAGCQGEELETTFIGMWDFLGCHNITLENLHIQSQTMGFRFLRSHNMRVSNCLFTECRGGIVCREGSMGSIDSVKFSSCSGFAGCFVHGSDTSFTMKNIQIFNNKLSGIWVCGHARVTFEGKVHVCNNFHYGIRVGFGAKHIGSGGTVVVANKCSLTVENNHKKNVLLENGGTLIHSPNNNKA